MILMYKKFYKTLFKQFIKLLCCYLMLSNVAIAQPHYLAIIIDDIGYRPKQDNAVYQLPKTVSVAIIPSAPYAHYRNKQAKLENRDILIHLPMETISKQKLDKGALTLGMNQEQVNNILIESLKTVPNAIGLNNHMGSAATADPDLMQKLMFTLKENHLSFLDSRTNNKSIAAKMAKNMGIKSLSRHIFLDNENTGNAIEKQFHKAIQHARKYGTTIVIGHPRKNTIAVLQQELSHLPDDIQLINIDALWKPNYIKKTIKPFNILFEQKNITSYLLSDNLNNP